MNGANKNNPLLVKPEIGKAKKPLDPKSERIVHGVKSKDNNGGAAVAINKWQSTTTQPTRRESFAPLGKHRPMAVEFPDKKALSGKSAAPIAPLRLVKAKKAQVIENKVHGKKSLKEPGVGEIFAANDSADVSQEASEAKDRARLATLYKPVLGQSRPPVDPSATDRVHGLKSIRKDGGTREAIGSWDGEQKEDVIGMTKRHAFAEPLHLDDRTHGKASKPVELEGGVAGAVNNWVAPDASDRVPVGKSRPPLSKGVEEKVHGRKSVRKDGGAVEALTNWRPLSPMKVLKPLPPVGVFGKKSEPSPGITFAAEC